MSNVVNMRGESIEGFVPGSFVIVNLVNPKEKFWGVLRSLTPVGLTIRGINLDSFEDWVRQVARGGDEDQTLDLVTMFVPLFRLERMFMDESVGAVQSYSERFAELVRMTPEEFLRLEVER
ncbi:MAG TPA: hypothetical protein VMS56_02430 [Thermoanaerobaculia bacterium]|nr:hypothetical protein [Thermoanaerobaculia bacterium]